MSGACDLDSDRKNQAIQKEKLDSEASAVEKTPG
jgi:hypothetical protein